MELNTSLESFFRLKPTRKADLEKGGIRTVRDLLYHFPTSIHRTESMANALTPNIPVQVSGVIQKIGMRRSRGKKRTMIAEATIDTGERAVRVVWFNQPYIARQYPKGTAVRIQGKTSGGKSLYLANPIISRDTGNDTVISNTLGSGEGSICPVYRSVGKTDSLWFGEALRRVLEKREGISDPIPVRVRGIYTLPSRADALYYIHRPRTEKEYGAARKRFAFEQIFFLKLKHELTRGARGEEQAYPVCTVKNALVEYTKKINYQLTAAQKKSVGEVLNDMRRDIPMARLLEGDVGSGKTAVAAAALQAVASAKHPTRTGGFLQGVYMAPTELLARQQFAVLCDLFRDSGIACGLITGGGCEKFPSKTDTKRTAHVSRTQMKQWMEEGEVRVIVGTHALIQKGVGFRDCALVVIDEQHRFGVAQRYSLAKKGGIKPHTLSMTATPIPRTLALALYGDLDISIIDELPKGRKPPITTLVSPGNEHTAYEVLRREIEAGRQVYIVCPRIEDTEKSDMTSVTEETKHIQQVFPDAAVAMIHGKMKKQDQQACIARFADGEIDILIATTVVEVGVNVPNASCMVIQNAERFGLAQLHQLRGRVMRSEHTPYCFAFTPSKTEETLARLRHFEKYSSGFVLAEKDLEIRGAGELDGLSQSGFSDLAMEALKNIRLVNAAGTAAHDIITEGIDTYPDLKKELKQRYEIVD